MTAIRTLAAIAYQIISGKTARALEGKIDFTFRWDELLRNFRKAGPPGKMIQGLIDYSAALLHLLEAHIIPVQGIAPGPGRDFEIKPVIYFIGFGSANIVRNPAGAKIRPRNPVLTGKLPVDNTDVPGAINKDDILGYQVVVIGPASRPSA